jgi:hypothetical protein
MPVIEGVLIGTIQICQGERSANFAMRKHVVESEPREEQVGKSWKRAINQAISNDYTVDILLGRPTARLHSHVKAEIKKFHLKFGTI